MAAERDDARELLAGVLLTDEQIATVEEFSAEVRDGLDVATFARKRQYLDRLQFAGRLTVEDGELVMYARCRVMGKKEKRLTEDSMRSTPGPSHNSA